MSWPALEDSYFFFSDELKATAADEILEGRFIDFVVFMNLNGTSDFSVEAGVEDA